MRLSPLRMHKDGFRVGQLEGAGSFRILRLRLALSCATTSSTAVSYSVFRQRATTAMLPASTAKPSKRSSAYRRSSGFCPSSQVAMAGIAAIATGITLALFVAYAMPDSRSQHMIDTIRDRATSRHHVAKGWLKGSTEEAKWINRRGEEYFAVKPRELPHEPEPAHHLVGGLPGGTLIPAEIGTAKSEESEDEKGLRDKPKRGTLEETEQGQKIAATHVPVAREIQSPIPVSLDSGPDSVRQMNNAGSHLQGKADASLPPTITKTEAIEPKKGVNRLSQPPATMPFVIGGSDGSGTRMVANLLQLLGCPLVHSDITTLDLHGDAPDQLGTGGWPDLVDPILRAAGSLQYDPETDGAGGLQPAVRERSRRMLRQLMNAAAGKGRDLLDAARQSVQGGAPGALPPGVASGTPWGFKAPASLAVFPMLARWHSPVRLVHVVRDGRDIAISGNTSPVKKFWGPLLGSDRGQDAARAKQAGQRGQAALLWSRWNTATLEWARDESSVRVVEGTAPLPATSPDGLQQGTSVSEGVGQPPSSEYVVVRVEDLLLGGTERRLAALRRLARLVGSPRSEMELCCMLSPHYWQSQGSHSQGFTGGEGGTGVAVDAGQGGKFSASAVSEASARFASGVQSRFGKWRREYGVPAGEFGPASIRADEFAEVSHALREGLDAFGYDAIGDENSGGRHKECGPTQWISSECVAADSVLSQLPWLVGENRELEEMASSAGPERRRRCGLKVAMDWRGCPSCKTDLRDSKARSVDECCRMCEMHSKCSHFTYDVGRNICFLKQDGGAAVDAHGGQLISGQLT